jgi:3-deoxy-D-manno-octulosonic-acid transferase
MRRISLTLYNLLFFPLLLLLLPGYLLRVMRRGGYRARAAQRFGLLDKETCARIGMGRLWLHAVSVGEVGIALKFATKFHQRHPDVRLLISTTTSTGLAILERHASDWLEPLANPVDFPIITSRLVRKLCPSALLTVEADLWPNRIAACRKLGIPTALINARLSRRSETRFHRARLLTSPFFNQLDLITLSEQEDIARWLSLGADRKILSWTGNIKYDVPVSPTLATTAAPATFAALPKVLVELGWQQNDPVFLAASTHQGEELEVSRAYLQLRQEIPRLRLLIAPRHVERRASLVADLEQLGLSVILRSAGTVVTTHAKPTTGPADLLLIDTTGELAGWYPLATVVFVGKSLPCSANRGGQNMIEPLQAGSPVLIGPHTGNFEPLASQLVSAGAATRVHDAESIVMALRALLNDSSQRNHMVVAAQNALASHQGATERTCELVERLLRHQHATETP